MYQISFSRSISNQSTDMLLFTNPSSSSIVVRFEPCVIEYEISRDSTWKIYLDPTITSNGTQLTLLNNQSGNIGLAYRNPVISDDGTLLKSFIINKNYDYTSLVFPMIHLHPDRSILLKKTSSESGSATITLSWRELP